MIFIPTNIGSVCSDLFELFKGEKIGKRIDLWSKKIDHFHQHWSTSEKIGSSKMNLKANVIPCHLLAKTLNRSMALVK